MKQISANKILSSMSQTPKLVPLDCELVKNQVTVALIGQPNVGKSTIFNLLTGLNQHVGNWPGKTIEKREGSLVSNGTDIQIVDLPGTYSLTANSPEEQITRDFIIHEQPDVVIVIVNAATIESGLYLLTEVLSLSVPVVLGLNLMDVAVKQGLKIESHVLEAAAGLPVVPMVASKTDGVTTLIETAEQMAIQSYNCVPVRPEIPEDIQTVLNELKGIINGYVPQPYAADWVGLKLLEGDKLVTQLMLSNLSPSQWEKVVQILALHEDAMLAIAHSRYRWIQRMVRAAVTQPAIGRISLTDRIDRIVTHPHWGVLILLLILGGVFWLTYSVSVPIQEELRVLFVEETSESIRSALVKAPGWIVDLVTDGVIAGTGTVLTFIPVLVIFFTILGLLEQVGYLSRAAFVMDRYMHPLGLHGKSFLSLFLGFGCNVPAVLATRIIESKRERLLTILLTPFVPCLGRLVVLTMLTPFFFGDQAFLITWFLVALSILVLIGFGLLLNGHILAGIPSPFIMELPLYQVPNFRAISRSVWSNTLAFVRNAGTIIVVISVVVWCLATFPGPTLEGSALASFGRILEPIGHLLGLDWRMMVAILSSFLAKENTIATLGVLFGAGSQAGHFQESLASAVTPEAALTFLVVQMLFVPCIATVAVIYQETKSWHWTSLIIVFQLVISLGAGILTFQVSSLFF